RVPRLHVGGSRPGPRRTRIDGSRTRCKGKGHGPSDGGGKAMIDERERYERAFQQFQMPEPAWDRLIRRRDRKRRNQRIAAGVVGIAVFVAGGGAGQKLVSW